MKTSEYYSGQFSILRGNREELDALFAKAIYDARYDALTEAAEIARWKHPVSSSPAHYQAKWTEERILDLRSKQTP